MPRRTRLSVLIALLAVLVVAGAVGYRAAMQRLQAGVTAALGPRASIAAIGLGWSGVQIDELRIRSAPGWPAEDELRAHRVLLRPSLASLWRPGWHVGRVTIEDGYVSLLRSRDGRLRVLPALLETKPAARDATPQAPGPAVRIESIVLDGAAIDFFDASVRQPAHRMQLEKLEASLGPVDWPTLATPTAIELRAAFKGPHRTGRLAIDGELTLATRDAQLKASVHGVDLVALQPYLLKVNEGGVRAGTLDLTLDARVKAQQLHAPGHVTLTGLELSSGGGALSTFAGVPRQAVLAAMSRDGRIAFAFTLEGRLDDPAFSLNENLAAKLAGGLADTLGVSLGGVVQGVGNVIKGLFGR
jgi:hypothetical protein